MTADVGTSSQPRNSKEEGGSVLDISLGEVRKGETSSLTGEGSTNNATADDSFAVQDQTLVDGVNSNVSGSQQSPSRAEHQQHTKSPSSSSVLSSSKVKEKEVMPTAATNAYSGAWDITSWNPSGKSKTGDTSFSTNHDTTLVAGSGADQTVDIALATLRKEGDEAGARKAENSDFLKPSDGGEVEGGSGANLAPKPSPTPSRRPSALQLKPPSPQPWDLVEPPEGPMKGRSVNELSPADISQKFGVTPTGRPLVPKSSYYFGPPAPDSAYGTPPMGRIGVHHPREILRIERDYSGGEVIQFAPIYPLELENRLTPTQFLESINSINEILISAHSLRRAFLDNLITVMSLQLSRLFLSTHFQKEMKRLRNVIEDLNVMLFNPVGLNMLWPGDVAFLFLEIEYY